MRGVTYSLGFALFPFPWWLEPMCPYGSPDPHHHHHHHCPRWSPFGANTFDPPSSSSSKNHDWQWKVFPNDCIGQVRRGREGDSVEGSDRRLCVRVLGCKTWQLPIDGLGGSIHTIIIIILASWVRIGFEKVEDDEEDWRFNQVAIAQAEDWHGSHRQSTKLPSSFAASSWWRSSSSSSTSSMIKIRPAQLFNLNHTINLI